MRDFLRSKPRWLQAGWLLPLVLVALPNCAFPQYELAEEAEAFDPGPLPQTSAIMCDIPKVPAPDFVECATDEEENEFKSLEYGAIGLAQGESFSIALDYSDDARSKCDGHPKKVAFHGPFPGGTQLCLNCTAQIPGTYVDGNAACVAKCVDLVHQDGIEPAEGAQSYCEAKAKVSTNFNKDVCYPGACVNAGTPLLPFDDPRRHQEPVVWSIDPNGFAESVDNSVGKPDGAPEPVNEKFDSGAASKQTIESGDAWIEFEAKEADMKSHVLGVASDTVSVENLVIENIAFALSLNRDDNNVYVLQNGIPTPGAPVGKYMPEKRFRVEITDNHDHTASISYVRLDEACEIGTPCKKTTLAVSQGTVPYPLRVFAMFRERSAQLTNVTMVYIKKLP